MNGSEFLASNFLLHNFFRPLLRRTTRQQRQKQQQQQRQ